MFIISYLAQCAPHGRVASSSFSPLTFLLSYCCVPSCLLRILRLQTPALHSAGRHRDSLVFGAKEDPFSFIMDAYIFPFFTRARAKGSCCMRLPLGVWIELQTMPDRAWTTEKSDENQRFFNSHSWPEVGPKWSQSWPPSRPKVGPKWPQVCPKSARSRPKVDPKSPQSWPKVIPKSAQVGPKSAQSRPNVDPKSAQGRPKVRPSSAQGRP